MSAPEQTDVTRLRQWIGDVVHHDKSGRYTGWSKLRLRQRWTLLFTHPDVRMHPSERLVLFGLSSFLGADTPTTYRSLTDLEGVTMLARSTVALTLNNLEAWGWILRTRGRPGRPTTYQIYTPEEDPRVSCRLPDDHPAVVHSSDYLVHSSDQVVHSSDQGSPVSGPQSCKSGGSRKRPPSAGEHSRAQDNPNSHEPELEQELVDYFVAEAAKGRTRDDVDARDVAYMAEGNDPELVARAFRKVFARDPRHVGSTEAA